MRTSSPRELLSGVATAPDALALFRRTSTGLRRHVPFDAALWRATDPVTGLTAAPVLVENLSEGGCGAYWESELFEQNVVLFRDLVRAAVPAAALRATTGDRPRMSALYERFMRPRNLADELRAVFRVDGRAWGMLSLFRERGRRPFDDDDTLLLGRLSGPLAHRLRSYARPAPVPSTGDSGGAGVLVFDTDVNLISINARARRLLAEMPPSAGLPTRFGIDVPAWVLSTALSARTSADARIRVRSRTGGWLICHGTALRGPDGRVTSTAMVIEPAKASEVAAVVIAAYELSPREAEITQLIAGGLATSDIAGRLHLSPHTVRDHVKAIFDKVGVTSRKELVAKLFVDHTQPAVAGNTVRVLG
ncbi:MAG TPA: helix-turn-helix transcriptional regulator [Pseudonocardia sp.]|uniref:helix-turn-helix transcriptional regulator n=1 Tax=Pseudonocardia sp. TaxID=60912 RepID=UPI002B4B0B1A|nr:helix-turn-helix transcriptional regulator [Pseudonocardia sp.]HLU58838.1 helix-turn-helix transcriptional regulator [Pseudonocardia sp.]